METTRRFLVLTPVAFVVTGVAALIVMTLGDGAVEPAEVGLALLFALGLTLAALLVVLVSAGLLRLLGVRNAWATLGLAAVLVGIVYAVRYVTAAPWRGDEEEWDLLIFMIAAVGLIPTWLTYAVGLLAAGLRDSGRRNQTA